MSQMSDFLKSHPISAVVMLIGILGVLGCSIFFMPASELMPAVTYSPSGTATLQPGLSPVRSEEALNFFKGIADSLWGTNDLKRVDETALPDGAPGDVRAYIQYSIWLGAALIFGAIAISAVGRFDSEEKTTIPVKK